MSESVAERRASARVDTEFQLQGAPEEGGVVARMVASNLSTGGLYCTSNADFPEMTRLAVRMLLPTRNGNSEPLDVHAVVVRRREVDSSSGDARFELALFFTGIDDATRERIARFIQN